MADIFQSFCSFIKQEFFSTDAIGEEISFAVDKYTIQKFCIGNNTSEVELINSVRKEYWKYRHTQEQILGLLAIQLYAASLRKEEYLYSSRNYTIRLRELLNWDDNDWKKWMYARQDEYWETFYNWCTEQGFYIKKCMPFDGPGRFVQYPIEHSKTVFTEEDLLYISNCFVENHLFPGEDISYSEELYSKALILSLLNQGDIRTKTRKIHQFLMFPLFQLSKIISVYNNYYLNEYLNELNFILNKKIHHQVESDNKNKKVNLGYYNFPFEYFLSPKDNEIKNDYLDDINFKQFICKVIIDYFYSFDNLLFDDDLLLFFKINIKEENEIEVNDKNLDNNHKRIKTDESFNIFNKYISECLLDEMSYKKYAPNDIVISFGENNYSQTAQENSDIIMNPRIIYSLLNKKIKKIFSGYNNNFAIDEKDNIYSWGLNTDGQCGIPEKKIIKIPKEVKILDLENEEKIINITCGNNFTFFLSNNNKVYLCGYNLLTKEKYFSPKRIKFSFEKEKISRIEVGFKFCLILTGWGNVYSYGEVENGELGHEINYEKTNDPKLVLNIRNIRLISCGYRHCLAIGKNNIVFCWGSNENGQLGLNINSKNKNIINIPNKLNINNEITNIFCGKDFTIFHTEKKEILVCGKNEEDN